MNALRVAQRYFDAWIQRDADHGGTHPEAVRKFLGPELAAGGMTSVWSSGRFIAYVRCPICMQMVNLEKAKGECPCGEALPEPLPYW